MTDHKFTDDEVIKAMKCCTFGDCYPCAYKDLGTSCRDNMIGDTLALTNRQRAEIKRLYIALEETQKATKYWKDIAHRETGYVKAARAEAIKEFAQRLKSHLIIYTYINLNDAIDTLVKEMTEENK